METKNEKKMKERRESHDGERFYIQFHEGEGLLRKINLPHHLRVKPVQFQSATEQIGTSISPFS